ncbi:MAG: LptF/LptG family permease [Nitrospiraceae bacterium]|nr:LptF/LptG family permease [Nitrospiraceae bacterium]
MKTIHKSALKELALALTISLPLLNFILMMEKVMKISRLMSSVGASAGEFFRVIIYMQPELMLLTLPMSFLLSVLYVYGRMNADTELVVLRASGMSFRQAVLPAFIVGLACMLAGFFVSFHLGPEGRKDVRLAVTDTLRARAPYAIEPGVFNTLVKNTVIYVTGRGAGGRLSGVFIYDRRSPRRTLVINARQGFIRLADEKGGSSLLFDLKDGLVHTVKGSRLTEIFFRDYRLVLPLALEKPGVRLQEMAPRALLALAAGQRGEPRTETILELYRRFTFPLFNLAMMFMAPALSLYAGKKARLGGLAMGTMVFSVYYVLLTNFEKLSEAGRLPAFWGGWSAYLIILAVSVFVFRKVGRR